MLPRNAPAARAAAPGGTATATVAMREACERAVFAASLRPEADCRAEAALALGAAGGADAVLRLQAMLADPEPGVVAAALLGLGMEGSARSRLQLQRRSRGEADPELRGVALFALALAGGDPTFAAAAFDLAAPAERELLASYLAAHACLVGGAPLAAPLRTCLADGDAGPTLRAFAAIGLAASDRAAALPTLQPFGNARSAPLRAAGRAALAGCGDAAAAALLAHLLDGAAAADGRTFLLLQLGRSRMPVARERLLREVESGPKPTRAVAGLALGLCCRGTDDAAAAAALLRGCSQEANADQRPAWLLAFGLSRCAPARGQLAEALATAVAPTARAAAADGLVLLEGAGCLPLLQAQLAVEADAALRVQFVELAARCGGSIGILADAAARAGDGERPATLAAVGWLGDATAVDWLLARVAAGDAGEAAAALHGLARARRPARASLQPVWERAAGCLPPALRQLLAFCD